MIGTTGFGYCKGLKAISLPSTLDSIANFALTNTALESVSCKAITPPKCDAYAIRSEAKKAILYVPEASVSAYKAAPIWKTFGQIQTIANVGAQPVADLGDVSLWSYGANGSVVVETFDAADVAIFDAGGRLISRQVVRGRASIPVASGIYFVQGLGRTTKVIVR